jgi:hypothetical protein
VSLILPGADFLRVRTRGIVGVDHQIALQVQFQQSPLHSPRVLPTEQQLVGFEQSFWCTRTARVQWGRIFWEPNR